MNRIPFYPADILIPKTGHEKWAVVACDQFTSQPEYWEQADRIAGDAPSALRLILPEVYLNDDPARRIQKINETMEQYRKQDLFDRYPDSMVYIRRTLPNGAVRHGILGCIDLEAYDYRPEKKAPIRATEGTVLERIPPRVAIRRDAPMELPHIMVLIDDPENTVIGPVENATEKKLYDFDLMLGGGHLRGDLIGHAEQERIISAIAELVKDQKDPFPFAMGDGNHSLATAKACYEQNPTEKNRYALVEIVNVHDAALEFEPIYRLFKNVDAEELLTQAQAHFHGTKKEITLICAEKEITLHTDGFSVGEVQNFVDAYLKSHTDASVDYIHGADVLRRLSAEPNCVGFLFDGMEKSELFPVVARDGALPRKTFSMGEAQSKRYYMEAREIR